MTTLYHGNKENWTEYKRSNMDIYHQYDVKENYMFLTNSEVVAKDYIPKGLLAVSYDKLSPAGKAKVDAVELPEGVRFLQSIPHVMEGVTYFEITPYGELTGKAILAKGLFYWPDQGTFIDVPEDKMKLAAEKQTSDNRANLHGDEYLVIYPQDPVDTNLREQLVLPFAVRMTPKNGDLLNNAKLSYFNHVLNFKAGGTLKTVEVELKNPYVIDYGGCQADWVNCYTTEKRNGSPAMKEALKYARENGHDGLVVKNVRDVVGKILNPNEQVSDMYIVFNPSTVKVLKTEVLG